MLGRLCVCLSRCVDCAALDLAVEEAKDFGVSSRLVLLMVRLKTSDVKLLDSGFFLILWCHTDWAPPRWCGWGWISQWEAAWRHDEMGALFWLRDAGTGFQ